MSEPRSGERTFRYGQWQVPIWATVFAVGGIVFMLGLSIWQVQRLQWKEGLIAARQAALAQPPVDLPTTIEDPASWAFRPVRVTGTFDHSKEVVLGARSLNGNIGYHLITPLIRADGSAVLVDRGWIPLDRRDPGTRPESLVAGEVTVDGIARETGKRNWLTPEDSPEENFWFIVDIPAIGRHLGLARVLPVFVEAGPGSPDTFPIGGQTRVELPNDHLQYAITWFLLAVALAVIYVLYVRRLNMPEPESSP
jgi:surfeit locus 1 family protein